MNYILVIFNLKIWDKSFQRKRDAGRQWDLSLSIRIDTPGFWMHKPRAMGTRLMGQKGGLPQLPVMQLSAVVSPGSDCHSAPTSWLCELPALVLQRVRFAYASTIVVYNNWRCSIISALKMRVFLLTQTRHLVNISAKCSSWSRLHLSVLW